MQHARGRRAGPGSNDESHLHRPALSRHPTSMPRRRDLPEAKPWYFAAAMIKAAGLAERQTRDAVFNLTPPVS
jgi:hypothetical protein